MQCPKCRTKLELHRVQQGHVNVAACVDCRGVWFDGQELEAALPEVLARLAPPLDAASTTFACARCRQPLAAFHYPQTRVRVARCPSCHGVWFEPADIREIRTVISGARHFGNLSDEASSLAHDPVLQFFLRAVDTMPHG